MDQFLPLALAALLAPLLTSCRKKPFAASGAVSAPAAASAAPLAEENAASAVPAANPRTPPPNYPGLSTTCSIVSPTTIEGYANNDGGDAYLVSGIVEFSFGDPALPHANLQTPANARIPGRGSALVARTRLAFSAKPGGPCRLDLGTAVKKL
jgi:hypothetical protein